MQEGELNRLTGCRVCDMQRSNERRYLEPHCHSPYKDFKLGPSLTSWVPSWLLQQLLQPRMQNVEHFKQRENFALLLLGPKSGWLHFLISDWLWGNDHTGADMEGKLGRLESIHTTVTFLAFVKKCCLWFLVLFLAWASGIWDLNLTIVTTTYTASFKLKWAMLWSFYGMPPMPSMSQDHPKSHYLFAFSKLQSPPPSFKL